MTPSGNDVSFGIVKVKLSKVESFDPTIPTDPNTLIKKMKEEASKIISDPEFDELERIRRLRA